MTIGENIKRIRIQRGLTQAELGYLLKISESNIRGYELGIRNPKPSRLAAIAHALGVNVEVLLNSDFDDITAMQRLFQLFRQYDGYFDQNGNLKFRKLHLASWKERWEIYQKELEEAENIKDVQIRQDAIEDAEDKFNWWMDTYPCSDAFNISFDETDDMRYAGMLKKCMECTHAYTTQNDADEIKCRCRKGCNFKKVKKQE